MAEWGPFARYSGVSVLRRQRDRWQRGLLETLWRHRKMFANPRYGGIGMVAMPFFLFFEALGPVVEISGVGFSEPVPAVAQGISSPSDG